VAEKELDGRAAFALRRAGVEVAARRAAREVAYREAEVLEAVGEEAEGTGLRTGLRRRGLGLDECPEKVEVVLLPSAQHRLHRLGEVRC
jgi:hypothetical protein